MKFKEYILQEMPQMSLRGKVAYAGDSPLRTSTLSDVVSNMVMFRQPTDGLVPAGWTMVYFMDSDESAESMKAGKIPMLMIPRGTFHSGGSPITDVWKKKFQQEGTEHILGLLEGHTNEEQIYIDMISVRNQWQRNKIATLMINLLKNRFPNASVTHSSATDKGKKLFSTIGDVSLQPPE